MNIKTLRCTLSLAILFLLGPIAVHAQDSVLFSNASTVYVDGTTSLSGIIFDNGGPSANYSNHFAGMVIITARLGDTIELSGSYTTEWMNDYLYVYNGSGRTGTTLGTYSGTGNLHCVSVTGVMTLYFSSDAMLNRSGFALHYTVHPTPCSNFIANFSFANLTATSVTLTWHANADTAAFHLSGAGVDTVVTGSYCQIDNLSPNTDYTFLLAALPDTAQSDCLRTLSLRTPCFNAFIRGVRPICDNDTLILLADSADSYLWSTGQTTRTISVTQPGVYTLVAATAGGCFDTDQVTIARRHMDLVMNLPTVLCPSDSALIWVGFGSQAPIRVDLGQNVLSEANRIFLPDGVNCEPNGCSYRSELDFSDFAPDARITDVNDIRYVMLNIEHSYAGDIYINITCPNGQSADIMRYGGTGNSDCNSSIATSSRGWQSGSNAFVGTDFGQPISTEAFNACDSTAYNNRSGTGWRYCWSNATDAGYTYAPGDGLIYRMQNVTGSSFDSSNVAMGSQFYHPDQSLSALIGCPMNGTWFIEVIDGWSGDNGYIFGWTLALNPERLSRYSYVPTVEHADLLGPWQERRSDTSFCIVAPDNLQADTTVLYTVHIYDSNGCRHDTTFSLTFRASTTLTLFDTVPESSLPRLFRGHTLTADTSNLVLTIPTPGGCDSTLIYNLHILPNSRSSIADTVCDSQLPYLWNGRSLTAAGTYVDTLSNAIGADSIITLVLEVLPTYTIHLFDTICDNQTVTFAGTILSTPGTYSVSSHTLTNPQCDSSTLLHLTVHPTSIGRIDTSACDSLLWQGTAYRHSLVDTLGSPLPNTFGCDSITVLRLTVHHTPTVRYLDTCTENQLPRSFRDSLFYTDVTDVPVVTPSDSLCDSLIIYSLHVFRNVITQFDTTVCLNHLPLTWHGHLFTGNASFRDTLTCLNGADSIIVATLHTHPYYSLQLADTICQGDTYLFGGKQLTLTGTYADSLLTLNQCDSVINLQLQVLDTIHFQLLTDYTCLSPAHYLITADSSALWHYQWTSLPPDPFLTTQQHLSQIQVNPTLPTVYFLTVSHAGTARCAAVDSLYLQPIVPLHIDWEINKSSQQLEIINNSIGFTSQSWFVNGQPTGNHTSRLVYYADSETDSVIVTLIISNDLCADTLTQTFSLLNSSIYFPNVFTPSADLNNRFAAIGHGILEYEIWIFDRQGVKIYHSTDMSEGWDGTANGIPCRQAAYVYLCRYRTAESPSGYQTAKGTVVLLR